MAITFPFDTHYFPYISETAASEASDRIRTRASLVSAMIRSLAESHFTGAWDERTVTIYRQGDGETKQILFFQGVYVTAVDEVRVNGEAFADFEFDKASQAIWRTDGEAWPVFDSTLDFLPDRPDCNIEIDVTSGWPDDEAMDADVDWRTVRWVILTAEQTVNRLGAQNDSGIPRKPVGFCEVAKYFDSVTRKLL